VAEPYPSPARDRWRPAARFVVRTVRRTFAESLYLLIAPVIITAALLGALAGRQGGAGPGSRRWAAVAHALLVLPVALVTWVVTALWWFAGAAAATDVVRNPPTLRAAEGTAIGLVLLCVLPLVTRLCVAVLVGLGPALLGEAAVLHRRIGWLAPAGLPADPGPAGPGPGPGSAAGPAVAVTADAAALRRLERDIHDGPQQRLVRLAMDLGRAEHHLANQPEAARAALADAIAQTQETLDELRALSRGVAPPVLADRGLPAALAAGPDRTAPAQARLVDRVPAPVLHWRTCRKTAQCATARLPLDYRHPDGQKIRIALLRIKAKDPRHRLGTIFVNPGGPGDPARDFAFSATIPPAVPRKILDRFDIVGADPRGVGGSTPIRCFASGAERTRAEGPLPATWTCCAAR
jgi:hypothetical protein